MITNTTAVAYMRASTQEQDANRAREEIALFAKEHGITIRGFYAENVSGTYLERPELNRLLEEAKPHDILLLEKLDRLSRLSAEEWSLLKERIRTKRLRIVCIDIPTTLAVLQGGQPVGAGGFDVRRVVLDALNDMLLDIAAAWARDDYETRRKRQQQGIEKAKKLGRFKGKQKDEELRGKIRTLLDTSSMSQNQIAKLIGCSRNTVSRVARGE